MAQARAGAVPVTERDIDVAGQLGEMRADMRTVKHDLAQVSGKVDGLSTQMTSRVEGLSTQMTAHVAALTQSINQLNTKQERSLGFFAGVAFVIVSAGGLLIAMAKLIFGVHS